MLKPRFVFASGVYAPASGGSEISAHTMMSELTARGYKTVVLTGATVNASLGDEIRDRVHVRRIPESDLTAALEQETRAAKDACIVLTQLMWGEIVMRWSRQNKVPCVYFARSPGVGLDLSAEGPYAPTLIISNSATTREYIEARTGRVSPVVPPLVRLSDYLVRGRAEFDAGPAPEAITMFNPIVEKGGAIFKSIAELLPNRHFVAVRGWQHWKRVDGSWDLDLLRAAARGYGSEDVQVPEEVQFDDLPNVTVLPAMHDVRPVYAQTRLLLVPSQWAEPFGRIVLEAMANGIPVIYSAVGSLSDAANGAGVKVDQFDDPWSWVDAIQVLDDAVAYVDRAARSRARAARYDVDYELTRLESLLLSVVT